MPIRYLDEHNEIEIALLNTTPQYQGADNEWRIDPHPAFSRCAVYLTCNIMNKVKR